MFLCWKLIFIFVHSLLKWLAHFLLHKNVEMIWIKHFKSQQNKAIFHIINQIKVLRVVPLLNGHAPLNTWNYKEGLLIFKRMRLFLFTFIVFCRTVNLPLSQENLVWLVCLFGCLFVCVPKTSKRLNRSGRNVDFNGCWKPPQFEQKLLFIGILNTIKKTTEINS